MVTLYLDHQIYTFLKHKDDPSKFPGKDGLYRMEMIGKLHGFLEKEKDNFLIFYSHAHLLDLSSDKSGDRERLQSDLNFRAQWATNNYLFFDNKKDVTNYELAFPEEKFEPYWEEPDKIDFSNMLDLSEFEEYLDKDKLEELKQQKAMLENFKIPSLDELVPDEVRGSETHQKIKKMFGFMEGGNVTDLIDRFMEFMNRFQDEKGVYKELRDVVTSNIQKTKDVLLPETAPFEAKFLFDLAKADLSGPDKERLIKDNFLDLVKKQWSDRNKDKTPSLFDLHYECYFMLDMLGIEKEKATIARNMLHDAHHSFYGSHCEIVVSDDKQFRAKSKLLCKVFNLSTQILSIEEFIAQSFSFELENINSSSDFILRAKHDLNTALISSSRITSMFDNIKEIRPTMKYMHYFNQMLIVNEDNKNYLVFRHEVQCYLKHLPYKVVQGITDKAISLFGLDSMSRGLYKWEDENAEIERGDWRGRTWNSKESSLMLQISPQRNYLQLVIR